MTSLFLVTATFLGVLAFHIARPTGEQKCIQTVSYITVTCLDELPLDMIYRVLGYCVCETYYAYICLQVLSTKPHVQKRRRVSSVVEHSSTNPKVPGSILGPVSYRVMDYDEACFVHLTPGVVHNFPKAVGV